MSAIYINTQLVHATPMTLGEFYDYESWWIDDDDEPVDLDEPGYLVSTDPTKDAHTWIPKAEFDMHYQEVPNAEGKPAFQQRLLAEHAQLGDRLAKLKQFFHHPNYLVIHPDQRVLLQTQARIMERYHAVLGQRIAQV